MGKTKTANIKTILHKPAVVVPMTERHSCFKFFFCFFLSFYSPRPHVVRFHVSRNLVCVCVYRSNSADITHTQSDMLVGKLNNTFTDTPNGAHTIVPYTSIWRSYSRPVTHAYMQMRTRAERSQTANAPKLLYTCAHSCRFASPNVVTQTRERSIAILYRHCQGDLLELFAQYIITLPKFTFSVVLSCFWHAGNSTLTIRCFAKHISCQFHTPVNQQYKYISISIEAKRGLN